MIERAPTLAHTRCLLALCAALALAGCGRDSPETLAKSGEALLAKNDPAAAAIQFKAALQDADSPVLRLKLGRALLASGDAASAALELSKARETGAPANEVVPLLARALAASGENKRLVNTLDSVELPDPAAMAALKTTLSAAWAALSNPARSQSALNQALAAVPNFGPARLVRARAQALAGDVDAALVAVNDVLAAEPGRAEAWHVKGEILAFGKGDAAAARQAFEREIELDRYAVDGYASLANLAVNQKDAAAAAAQATRLRKVLPTHPHALFIDCQVALLEGRNAEAREKMQQLLRVGANNVGVQMLAGTIEGVLRSFVMAESHFLKALNLDPTQDGARRNLALTYINVGQHARALDTLKTLVGPESTDAASLALAGEALLRLGDARGAEALYRRSAQLNPTDPFVKTSLAMTQMRRGNFDRAFGELGELSRADRSATVADMAIISSRMARSEWPEALKAIDEALAKTPQDTALLELRGSTQASLGNFAAARASLEQALGVDPKFFSATASLAAIDVLENKPDDAARRLEKALKADPRNVFAGMALADLRAKARAGLPEQQKILSEVITASPEDFRPRLALIDLYLQNKKARDALQAAQAAAAALPSNPLVVEALARAQLANGESQQAISSYRRLTNLEPNDTRPLQRLAAIYRSAGDRKSAEAMWRRIAEVQPAFPAVNSRIAEVLAAGKRPAEALLEARAMQQRPADAVIGHLLEAGVHESAKAFDQAVLTLRAGLKKSPSQPELAIRLYQALLASGRKDEAASLAERWPKDNPKDGQFELELANSHLLHNDVAGAERVLRVLVARLPEEPLALNNLAHALAAQKKPGGVALVQRALAIAGENASMLDTFAVALSVEGQPGRAVDVQRRAVSLAPEDPSLRLGLARLAIQAGNKALARDELDALAARGKDFPLRAEVEKLQKSL